MRKPNVKLGIGGFFEQYVANDIGVFARGMYSDGKTEVDAYTSTDRSLTLAGLAKGTNGAGAGINLGWISKIHAEYLALGGVDGFVGDGAITGDGNGIGHGIVQHFGAPEWRVLGAFEFFGHH